MMRHLPSENRDRILIVKLSCLLERVVAEHKLKNNWGKIFLEKEQVETAEKFLQASMEYHDESKINLEELVNYRCEAWEVYDKSEGRFRDFMNLIIFTMYDDEEEGEIQEFEDIILQSLKRIDSSLEREFMKFIIDSY